MAGTARSDLGPRWTGADLEADTSFVHHLDDPVVDELDAALAQVEAHGLQIPFPSAAFPLPRFGRYLASLPAELEAGVGFSLIRGLPRERYTEAQCALLYWGVASHLGTPISQNTRGHLLGHVRDEGRSFDDPTARGYQTSARMDFHADQLPVDILGLFCLQTAKRGGASTLVSAVTVHEVIRRERPDLIDVLHRPFALDWRGEEPPGAAPWYRSPMFSEHEGRLTSRVTSHQYFDSVTRYGEELGLSSVQREALDVVQEVANRPELRLSMDFQPGDMQFLNNHVILHAREAFEDHPEPERKRHLLRMWIAVDADQRRTLAPDLAERYEVVAAGGIPVKA